MNMYVGTVTVNNVFLFWVYFCLHLDSLFNPIVNLLDHFRQPAFLRWIRVGGTSNRLSSGVPQGKQYVLILWICLVPFEEEGQ